MAFVRIWTEENFFGTATVLSVGPTNLDSSSVTIKSVEVAPYYCITVFDGANYTGNYQTYFGNKINTSSFSLIKSYIVQDSLVPYHNDYTKMIVPANEKDQVGTIILSRYINLQVDVQVMTLHFTLFLEQSLIIQSVLQIISQL